MLVDERVSLRLLAPDGATKAAVEMLVSAYAGVYEMRASPLRFANIHGPE